MLLCRAFEACSWAANHTRLRLQTSRAVQQAHPLPTRGVSTAAAANAAAIYAATAEMQDILSGMREYYCSTETGRHGLPTPTTADLSAVVVGVSRLVQIEWGAQHGWGECHLRDQVCAGWVQGLVRGRHMSQPPGPCVSGCCLPLLLSSPILGLAAAFCPDPSAFMNGRHGLINDT